MIFTDRFFIKIHGLVFNIHHILRYTITKSSRTTEYKTGDYVKYFNVIEITFIDAEKITFTEDVADFVISILSKHTNTFRDKSINTV